MRERIYVKASPGGVLLVACILETDSNYGNMTSKLIPNESAPSASEMSGRNRLHFTGESVVLILLDEQKRRPWPHRSLQCLQVKTAEVIWNCRVTAPGNNGQKRYRFVSLTRKPLVAFAVVAFHARFILPLVWV